jgi:predicted PurR-regulated permease PerM
MRSFEARRLYPALLFGVVLVGTLLVSLSILRPFLVPIAWSIVLALGFEGPWRWLVERMPRKRALAAALLSAGIALVVILPGAMLAVVVAAQASRVVQTATVSFKTQNLHSLADVVALPRISRLLTWLEVRSGVTLDDLQSEAGGLAARISSFIAQKGAGAVIGVLEILLTFVITIFILFFIFRDGESMMKVLEDLIPAPEDVRKRTLQSLKQMIRSIFRGSLLCALIQGATGAVGWWIAGLPAPALAGVAMAVLSLLPIGGTAIVWLPGTIWLWLSGHHGSATFLVVWGAVPTSLLADNFLRPLLISGTSELNTLIVFIGVFGGLPAFGLLGIFIGPMALAIGVWLLDVLREISRDARETSETDLIV